MSHEIKCPYCENYFEYDSWEGQDEFDIACPLCKRDIKVKAEYEISFDTCKPEKEGFWCSNEKHLRSAIKMWKKEIKLKEYRIEEYGYKYAPEYKEELEEKISYAKSEIEALKNELKKREMKKDE